MANERKNVVHSAGRISTAAPAIESGTGNFTVATLGPGVGKVRVTFVEGGANPGGGIAPAERVVLVSSATPGVAAALDTSDPAGDTVTTFDVQMSSPLGPLNGVFSFTVDRVGHVGED